MTAAPENIEERYEVTVFGSDVGGLDLSFYASDIIEALRIAQAETPKGTRGTEIIDLASGRLIVVLGS